MKRTIVKYEVVDNGKNVKIIAIENVASANGIKEEFGNDVCRIYLGAPPSYHKLSNSVQICPSDESFYFMARDGSTFTKEEFSEIISTMKQAGDRLSKIRDDLKNKKEIKEILI
jgi:hypothetical protein